MLEIDESALVGLDHISDFAIVRARPKDYKPKGQPKPKTDKQEYFVEAEDVAATEKIIELHKAIKDSMRRSLEDAQKIGELLFEQKKRIKHGFFTTWVAEQVGLNTRTAQNYMLLYHYKEELARLEITSLSDAYFVLRRQAVPDEIIDTDDSINTDPKSPSISVTEDLEKLSLPKRKATGKIRDWDLSEDLIQKLENGMYQDLNGTLIKVVVSLRKIRNSDPALTGRFIGAVAKILKPGGKIIFHKS